MMDFPSFNPNDRRPRSGEGDLTRRRLFTRKPSRNLGDRFIPVRSAMDFDVAQFLLRSKNKEPEGLVSPNTEEYRKQLANIVLKDHNVSEKDSRIFIFKAKPVKCEFDSILSSTEDWLPIPKKQRRVPRHISQTAERTLDAPDIVDDYYLNLLDWSSTNVVAIGLGNTLYLWNAANSATEELPEVREDDGPITSVSWALDGTHIAVGLNNSEVQIWDSLSLKKIRSLRGHSDRVGSLSWNGSILSSGGRDSKIFNHDVRINNHIISRLDAHEQEVCGLRWSPSGKQLASGGNDNLLYIWDVGNYHSGRYLHRLDAHEAAVKALAWCPYQSYLLASGGGTADKCIKFWNTRTGALMNSVDTESQVCSLQWNRHEKELLSSHGFSENQLILWKFPSMKKITEIKGHTARVLHLAQSPDGFTVASAAADETLRFWKVFGSPKSTTSVSGKSVKKETSCLQSSYMAIR
ncbi:cell division cycle 20.2, cofactor of APC complex-like [Tasmannia lanceolata]|uniref:cell division cycle 20.2, cofactor of APC complex-like n=1 Tax=Tasmannia lanceolata TaxID=3420 RepID=UPI0040637B77